MPCVAGNRCVIQLEQKKLKADHHSFVLNNELAIGLVFLWELPQAAAALYVVKEIFLDKM